MVYRKAERQRIIGVGNKAIWIENVEFGNYGNVFPPDYDITRL